jgi:phosphofructokinase
VSRRGRPGIGYNFLTVFEGLMKPIRTIGIVNGGGDAPGLNPVICAIVRAGINKQGMRVIGIRNGLMD